ncbi:MAG: hypothetical protein H6643_02385 [Caldilineaceae bacterium]|nr:hypothetical protein [Caldilineaceae bacterium]
MDGRIVLMATLAAVIWFLNAFFQRRSAFYAESSALPASINTRLTRLFCNMAFSVMAVLKLRPDVIDHLCRLNLGIQPFPPVLAILACAAWRGAPGYSIKSEGHA